MAEIASAWVSLVPSARGFGKTMTKQVGSEVDSAGKKIGSRLGGALKVGFLAGGVAVAAFAKASVGAASDAQQSIGATESIFGKFAKTVIKTSDRAANAVGLSSNQYRESANLLGSLFKNQGVALDKLSGSTEKHIGLASDLSAMYGGPVTDAVDALTAAYKGEFNQLEKYGVTLKQSIINTEAEVVAKEKYGKALADLTPAQESLAKQLATQALLFKQTTDAQGTFADESNTLAGQQARLAANFENLKIKIGTALIPVLTNLVGFITGSVIPTLERWWDNLAPAREAIGRLAAGIGEIVGLIRDHNWSAVWDTFKTATSAAFDAVVEAGRKFVTDRLVPAITDGLEALRDKWTGFWSNFWNPPDKAYSQVEKRTDVWYYRMSLRASETGISITANLMRGLSKMPMLATKVFAATVSALIQGFRGAPAKAAGIGIDLVDSLLRAFRAAPEKMRSAALFITQALLNGLKTAINAARQVGVFIILGLIGGIKSMAAAAASAAVDAVSGALAAAKNKLGIKSPSQAFAEVGMWSMRGLAKGIEDTSDEPAKAAEAAAKKMLDKLQALRDGVKSTIDSIKSDMASLAGSVASAFTGNLFEATDTQSFLGNLMDTKGQLKQLKAAFKKLLKWGIPAKFLSQMFASGNAALILDMAASGNRGWAMEAAQTFGQVNNLANSLGGQVARNEYGKKLDRANDHLADIRRDIKNLPKRIGKEINGAATAGQRGRVA